MLKLNYCYSVENENIQINDQVRKRKKQCRGAVKKKKKKNNKRRQTDGRRTMD